MSKAIKKIVICGVPGSDNLGDGVIADCLVDFMQQKKGYDAVKCDISYREGVVYDSVKGKNLGWFRGMPTFFRQLFVLGFFTLKYLLKGRRFLRDKMQCADLIVVGGGQLFSDVDWNFPLKLFFVAKMAEKLNIPIRICAVGVAGRWSLVGKYLLNKLISSPKVEMISVRDELSRNHLNQFFDISNAKLVPDPAVMSSLLKPIKPVNNQEQKIVGIGVADIAGLNYSSDKLNSSATNSLQSWGNLLDSLTDDDSKLVLFTNGALEDEDFLHNQLAAFLIDSGRRFAINPRFSSTEEMVHFLASLNSLYAFRLHANIIAASYNVPHFAIGWDNKVISFFNLQHRSEAVFDSIDSLTDAIYENRISLSFESKLTPMKVENMYYEFFAS